MKYQGTSKELLEQLSQLTTQYWEARRLPHATTILLEAWETWEGEKKNYKVKQLPWYDRLYILTFIVGFFGCWILTAIYAPWGMTEPDINTPNARQPTGFGLLYILCSAAFWIWLSDTPSKMWRTKKEFYRIDRKVSPYTIAEILGADSKRWQIWDAINEKAGLEYLPYKRQAWDLNGIVNKDYENLIKQLEQGFHSPVTVILDESDINTINFARLLVSKAL
jgi:hypothetical protein